MGIKVLYAGDSPVGGAANYLLGVLKWMKASVTHIPPAEKMTLQHLTSDHEVMIFSDYSHRQLSKETESILIKKIESGCGFLMIGGWGSYSGPFGGWRGSEIERMLPVRCKASDDRTNFPSGASLSLKSQKSFLERGIFVPAPAVCGLNAVTVKKNARTLVTARRVISNGFSARLEKREYPLLVVDADPRRRRAALTTDLAPHWCGGLVDWGTKTLKLPVNASIQVQVGNYYVQFIVSLLSWLARR